MFNKRRILLILALCAALLLSACTGGAPVTAGDVTENPADVNAGSDSWCVYWYLCGTDLESQNGAATEDLQELMSVPMPDNVKFVIETGGTSQWNNDIIDPGKIQRYVYDSEGFKLVDEQELANMGETDTLADFLSFASENYPADKTMMLFWDHGGGSVAGVAVDELHEGDTLTLDEMYAAFSKVYDLQANPQPFEVVGFDTCLMATVDTAYAFSNIGKYLVASEETEPACGWYYTGWAGAMAENPAIDGAELGKAICDTYSYGCELIGQDQQITLSVTDLTAAKELFSAYDNVGKEALSAACTDSSFFTRFERSASSAENYGGNTRQEGYTNMVDLGDLVRNSSDIITDNGESMLKALNSAVLYKINGPYRAQSSGLSCYYFYLKDEDNLAGFNNVCPSDAFKYLYEYGLTGSLSEEGMAYLSQMDYSSLPELPSIDKADLDGTVPSVDEDGYAVLDIGKENADLLSGVYFQLYYSDEANDTLYLLGRDNDLEADWDSGVFKDNFRGVWGALDGHIVYMELTAEEDGYNLYAVPVLLNDEQYNIIVCYDFTKEAFSIIGASRAIDENGMADRAMVSLKEGDVITTIQYAASMSSDDELAPYSAETFTLGSEIVFGEQKLADGEYIMLFEMTDMSGGSKYSANVTFTVDGGDIYTSVDE